jgi:hypothetical protein
MTALPTINPRAILSCAVSVQALVFETGLPEFPYSTAGTGFLVLYEGRGFVITALHLLRPDDLRPLWIFPTDTSHRHVPLGKVFFIPKQQFDEDFTDFAVIDIKRERLDSETGEGTAIDLSLAGGDWHAARDSSTFFVIGYPLEHSAVDYEGETIATQRFALQGRYAGPAASRFLHEIEVQDHLGLSDFRGLSGSPVFSWVEDEPAKGRITLCGMAVQGTVGSMRVRFIEWEVIAEAIKQKIKLGP